MKTKQIGSINSPLPLRLKIASGYLLLIVLLDVIVFVVRHGKQQVISLNAAERLVQVNSDDVTLTVAMGDAWTEPDEEKGIVSAPKVGDYYYADDTWSSTHTDNASNPCIGIVFQSAASRIGAKEKRL